MSELSHQFIEESLNHRFPGKIKEVTSPYNFMTITVAHDCIKDVISFLYNEPSLGFKFLVTCCGMHFPDGQHKFSMVYHLQNLEKNCRIRLKTFTNDDPPVFPTITDIYKSAGWMEREAYDFFGFKFTGHHNIKRILNMDSLEGWPLRKEFPLEDPFRKDKDDAMFGR